MSKTELAPAPKRRSYPKALKAQIVAKFTDHLPLYRQEGILARAGLQLPRSTLASGSACASQADHRNVAPVADRATPARAGRLRHRARHRLQPQALGGADALP